MGKAIQNFYARFGGWNMFDVSSLSIEVKDFLEAEVGILTEIFKNHQSYEHLVEVGCGYGRYMKWAMEHKFRYDGIDIVDWFIDLAQARVENFRRIDHEIRCSAYHIAAESISEIVFEKGGAHHSARALVFFPFNCFGNVNSLSATVESLRDLGSDVIISTFKTDGVTSNIRKDYYEKCGYTNLEISSFPAGALITSNEGLRAYAYEADFLQQLFEENGFKLEEAREFDKIGKYFLFRYISHSKDFPLERRAFKRQKSIKTVQLMVLEESAKNSTEKSHLMPLNYANALTKDFSLNSIRISLDRPVSEGYILKMDLLLQSSETTEGLSEKSSEKILKLAGQVTKVIQLADNSYDIVVKLFNVSEEKRKYLRSFLNSVKRKFI